MHVFKILATAALAAAFAGQALAQCSHLANTPPGANLSLTDDSTRLVALPFAFPFDGTSFTQMQICSNGFVVLGATSSTDNTPTEAELATAIGRRIAPLWWDLNPASTQTPAGGGVFYNAMATQVNVCWHNIAQFGTAAGQPIGDFELIMMASGDIYFNYGTTNGVPTLATVVGIGRGAAANPIVPVNGTGGVGWALNYPGLYTNPETTTATLSQGFAISALNINNLNGPGLGTILWLSPSAAGTYNVTGLASLPTCAPNTTILSSAATTIVGTGCSSPNGSIYEAFTTNTGTNPFDLSGTSIQYTRSGNDYTLGAGPAFDSNYTAGTILAGITDDSLVAFPFTTGTFTFDGIALTQIRVGSNGYINFNSTTTTVSLTGASLNSGPGRLAAFTVDLVPNTTTAPIYVEDNATMFRATWQAVPIFLQATDLQTFQVTLFKATGDMAVAYATMAGSSGTRTPLVGLTGGASTDLGSFNLATAGVANPVTRTMTGGFSAMSHTCSIGRFGTTFNMASTVPSNHFGFGIFGVGLSNPNQTLDAIFGVGSAPGCNIYTDASQDLIFPIPITAGATSFNLNVYAPIPALLYLQGVVAFTQAAAAGPWNAAGVISSNGRTFTVGF